MLLCACVCVRKSAVWGTKMQQSVLAVNHDYFGSCGETAETWPVFPFLLYSGGRWEYFSLAVFSSVFDSVVLSHTYPLGSRSTTSIIWPSTIDFTGITPIYYIWELGLHWFLLLLLTVAVCCLLLPWIFIFFLIKYVLSQLIKPCCLQTVNATKVNVSGFASWYKCLGLTEPTREWLHRPKNCSLKSVKNLMTLKEFD